MLNLHKVSNIAFCSICHAEHKSTTVLVQLIHICLGMISYHVFVLSYCENYGNPNKNIMRFSTFVQVYNCISP